MTATLAMRCQRRVGTLAPGVLLCAVIALSASFVSEHYGGPQLLYALLIGLSFHFLAGDERFRAGLEFTGRTLLRAGVALLGFRITLDQIAALGWSAGLITLAAVASTIAFGLLLSRAMRRPMEEGLISGCAVGICGASAALAVSSVLPATRENERFTLLAVVGVTLMSTLAMVAYPLLADAVGLTPAQAGVFFGATIHDVAQVVAAGMMLAGAGGVGGVGGVGAAESATIVKLFRVMLLMPVVVIVAMAVRPPPRGGGACAPAGRGSTPLIPGFLLAFIAFVLLATLGGVPERVTSASGTLSRALLVVAIASAGVKTSFADLARLGWAPIGMLVGETVWIAAVVATGLILIGGASWLS